MPRSLEVLLRRVQIGENGEDGIAPAATILTVTLTYPNALTPTRSTVKTLKLLDNADIDFTTDHNPASQQPYTYADRIVFKETIHGRTALAIALATVHKTSKLERLLAGIFGAVFGAGWKLLTGGIANVFVGAAVETVGAAHITSFEVDDEHANAIGVAYLEFDENTVPASPVQLPLTAPGDLSIEKFQAVPGAQPRRVKVLLLTKGQANGVVELELTTI